MKVFAKYSIPRLIGYIAATFTITIGFLVIIGWYLEAPELIQINKAFVPMQYNTALGFLLAGISLLLSIVQKKKAAFIFGLLVTLIGLLTLVEYIFGLELKIDQFFMEHYITVETSHPGRMAPNTALCFFLTGFILIIYNSSILKKNTNKIISSQGFLILFLGTFAFIGYFIEFEAAYGWGKLTKMAIHTAFGFMVLAIGILVGIWYRNAGREWFESSLRRKLFAYILFPMIILYVVVATYSIYLVKESTLREVQLKLKDLGWQATYQIDKKLNKAEEVARSTRRIIITQEELKTEEINKILINNLKVDDLISGSTIAFAPYSFDQNKKTFAPSAHKVDNEVKIIDLALEKTDAYTKDNNEWYELPRKYNKSVWSEPYTDADADSSWFITFSVPVTRDRDFWATIAVDVALKDLSKVFVVDDLDDFRFGILSKKGNFVLNSNNNEVVGQSVYRQGDDEDVTRAERSRFADMVIKGSTGFAKLHGKKGNTFFAFYTPIQSADWSFFIGIRESDVLNPVKAIIIKLGIIFIIVLLIFILILVFSSGQIIKPILALNEASVQLARGKLETNIIANPENEIGMLASNFTRTAQQLLIREKELKDAETTLKELNEDLEIRVKERTFELEKAFDRIKKSEEQFRTLVGNMPGVVYRCMNTASWEIIFISDEIEKLSGYPASDFLGENPVKTFADIIHPDDLDFVAKNNQVAIDKHRPYVNEYRIIDKDQKVHWVYDKGQALYNESGELLYLDGTIFDDTERRALVDELELTKYGVDNSLDVFWWINPVSSKILNANKSAWTSLGYTKEELLTKYIYDLDPNFPKEKWNDHVNELKSGKAMTFDSFHIKKDGGKVPVEVKVRYLKYKENEFIIAATRDITERKKAEEKLKESRERFDLAVNGSGDALWEYNSITKVNWFSPRFVEMLGYDTDELPHTLETWKNHVHPDEKEMALKAFSNHLNNDTPYDIEYRLKNKNGKYQWFRARAKSIRNEKGEALRTSGSVSDITERKEAENALSENQKILQTILDNMKGVLYMQDLDGRYLMVNKEFELVTGIKKENAIGKNDFEVFPYEVAEKFWHEDKKIIKNGISATFEETAPHPDGTLHYFISTKVPLFNEENKVYGICGLSTDITDVKRAEQKIKENETQLKTLVATIPGTVYRCRMDDSWTMVYLNEEIERLTGYPGEDFINNKTRSFSSIIHPKDDSTVRKVKKTAVLDKKSYTIEYRITTKDDELKWVYEKGQAEYDSEGNVTFLDGTIIDITERREIENQLSRAKQTLELAIDAANVGIWDWDTENNILHWDETMYKLFGVEKETFEVANEAWRKGLHPDDFKHTNADIQAALNGEKDFDSEFRVIWPDKSIHFIRGLANVIRNEKGKPVRMIGVNWDVTDWRLKEEELLKAKEIAENATMAKSQFLASMSHEIRTPMNAVIGLSFLALQTNLSPKQYDYIYKIKSSGQSLLGIINDILDFSKIEAGKLTIENTNFDLEKVFNDVATVVTYKAQEKGLEVVFNISGDVPLLLIGDPFRLSQILINLVNNAVKFTNAGEILILVEQEDNPPNTDIDGSTENPDTIWLKFTVKDTGIGINEEDISSLFESFTQADKSISRKYGGTGLGLAICKNLIEIMDGTIWAESKPGKGSVFHFNIKIRQQKIQKQKKFATTYDLRNKRVLLCDDNFTSLGVLSSMLNSFAFDVKSVTSGEEALLELKNSSGNPYDLVILDWEMPGLDGLEVAEKIKFNKKLYKIPIIIMVTAYTRDQVIKKVDELQLANIITKPVSYSTMFNTIMQAFGKEVSLNTTTSVVDAKHVDKLKERKGARILLVEDNEINQQVACEMIESAGFIVEVANDGMEAVNRLEKQADFDLVFMDLQMPVMDGITATEILRKNKAFDEIPIIAMTADVVAEVKEWCLEAGMNEFITKPIIPENVFNAIIKWIKPGKRDLSLLKKRKTETEAGSITFPDLEGISITEGLKRVNENKKLYQTLLFKFYNSNIDLIAQVKNAYNEGNEEDALRMIHTVKGVAGNIGAGSLYTKTVELEQRLKEKEFYDLNELLDNYRLSLEPVLKSIEEFKKTIKTEQQQDDKSADAELDEVKFNKLLGELNTLLLDNDGDSIDKMEEILSLPGLGKKLAIIKKIESALDVYDFDEALLYLNEVL
jgi:PAS domain S-box-containing protein